MKEWVDIHEFPNRIHPRKPLTDLDGKRIPTSVLYCQHKGVRMATDDQLYGLYMDERGNTYWVRLGDADYAALRVYGYTQARL